MNRHFTKEELSMLSKNMKRCSTTVAIRKCKLRPEWDATAYLLEYLKWEVLTIPGTGEDKKQLKSSNFGEGHVQWHSYSGK